MKLLVQEIEKNTLVRSESVDSEAQAMSTFGNLYRPTVASGSLKGKIRLIVIEGLDANACGGTHVRSLAEVEAAEIVSVEETEQGRMVKFTVGSLGCAEGS
jgi:Ser-tRNA(Ala) deacylase AlaX